MMDEKMIHDIAINYMAFCNMFGECITYEDAVDMVKQSNEDAVDMVKQSN